MGRLPFIDWVRGFAVLAMVLWHTGDAWLAPGLRNGQGWFALRFVGGLAAPSFLFLAGCAAALAARPQASEQAAARAFRASLGRSLEVVLIGYLLRYQTWMIDAGAALRLDMLRAWLPLGLGYALLVWSVNQLAGTPRKAAYGALVGGLLVCAGLFQVEEVAPGRFHRLLVVDVLQAIGASLALLAVLERAVQGLQKPWLLLGLGVAVACVTEPLTRLLPGPLPHAIAGYLGKYAAPRGLPAAALFPLFPWFSYACVGASLGVVLRRTERSEACTLGLGVLGAALAMITSEAHPYINRLLAAEPWLVHPVRIAFRVGMVLTLMVVGLVWASKTRGRVLLDYGKSSLRIYWAHMLFAYGVLGRPLQKHSGFATWALWVSVLLLGMWGLSRIHSPSPRARTATARIRT